MLLTILMAMPLSAWSVQAGGTYGVVSSYSMRYGTIDLDVGHYRIDRKVLRAKKSKLKQGAVVEFQLKTGDERHPNGIITSIHVFEGAKTVCDVECL